MSELDKQVTVPQSAEQRDDRFRRAYLILLSFVGVAMVIWLLTGFYTVGTDQVAIVERLGEYLKGPDGRIEEVGHGLHYHLPWPIDRVSIISTQEVFTMKVDTFNASPESYAAFKRELIRAGYPPTVINALFDPYLVTADKSVVHAEITVQFRITDAGAWLTSVSHEHHQTYEAEAGDDMRNQLFQHLAQRVLLDAVAHRTLDAVMRDDLADLQRDLASRLQAAMRFPDPADPTGQTMISTGVTIDSVSISPPRVPDRVKPAFDNLMTQRSNARAVRNNAEAEANSLRTKANGQKLTLIADANAYASNTVQAARGEADRFAEVMKQYERAPQVTRLNLFNDAVQTVTGAAKRIFFVQPGQRSLITVDPPEYDPRQVKPGG